VVKQPLPEPSCGHYVKIEDFWVQQGTEEIIVPENVSDVNGITLLCVKICIHQVLCIL
jgi:hypothetical protein